MLLTPYLYASPVLILPTLVSPLMRHSFQTIISFEWRMVPMVELMLLLVLDLILSIFVGPFMYYMLYCYAFMYHASLYMHCYIYIYIYLTCCICFVWVKIQNHIKSEKFKKFDRICLSTFHMWVWLSTFVLMT